MTLRAAATRRTASLLGDEASPLDFNPPPRRVCLLRLSAIGDACHVVAVLRALQAAWPQTRFTWIIGKRESKLLGAVLPEIEFITFDKGRTRSELFRLRRELSARRFDLLLHLQVALRASLISTLIRAPLKLGFDHARARELQWLFTNRKIEPRSRQHVLDGLLGFAQACGVAVAAPHWQPALPADALAYAQAVIPDSRPTLLISPVSSRPARNWRADRYAAVAAYAVRELGMRVILVGGPSTIEAGVAADIRASAGVPLIDQVGRDTLPQLLALMARASVLLTPDSGPAHMATMVGLPVIGLFAATNPARSGPYLSRELCVDRYAAAAQQFLHQSVEHIAWTTKIEVPGVMDLIGVEDVVQRLCALMQVPTGAC